MHLLIVTSFPPELFLNAATGLLLVMVVAVLAQHSHANMFPGAYGLDTKSRFGNAQFLSGAALSLLLLSATVTFVDLPLCLTTAARLFLIYALAKSNLVAADRIRTPT